MQLKQKYLYVCVDIPILIQVILENAGNSIYFAMSFWVFTHLMQISIFRHV